MQGTIAHTLQHLRLRRAHLWWTQRSPVVRRSVNLLTVAMILMSGVVAAMPRSLVASYVNVLDNGDFERGFGNQPGCGAVGAGWQCFTNGGGANYGFYDDQWPTTVADGAHSQLIEINTKGVSTPEHDRYAGIYQTVSVVDWAEYTLNLKGMIRTTLMDGDPWRYRVQVGWTNGRYADWTRVSNWTDVGWDSYYPRESPGGFSAYATKITAEDDYLTIYVRAWKKWGVAEEELDINFDTIALNGPSPYYKGDGGPGYGTGGPDPNAPAQPVGQPQQPAPVSGGTCSSQELLYNGGFEQGFNAVAAGHVGKSWGYFTNGGAANYGFYDDQWSPVIAEGGHAQLIEINSKGIYPADADRYAGIYQRVGWLQPGKEYELTIKGLLRGAGNEDDPYRFEAQWGYNAGNNTDWGQVSNWKTVEFGEIQSRTEPSGVRSYTVRFTPQSSDLVLFIRGWKKWGITEVEMDLNLDGISLRGCVAGGPGPRPGGHKPHHPGGPGGGDACVYTVQPGDILSWIAQRYNTSVHKLMAANGIGDPNFIYVGQVLQIPGCAAAPAAPAAPAGPPADAPAVAQPLPAPAPATQRIHTVAPGETLGYICNLYGVDVNTLASVNNIANVNFIYVGQQLIIP